MKKKTIFLILILLSLFIDVKAIGITINNRYYNATSDIVGNGFKYSVSNNTLELNNYNGSTISTLDDLTIIIKSDNYLTSSNTLPLVKAKNLVIIGEGSLTVTAPGIAFYADSIDIKNIIIKGSSKTEFISVTNSFSLDNVKMDADSGTTLLYGGGNNTINNSVIKSNNKWGLRYATNGITNIYNSDITMECSSICINSTATLSFNNTKALFHGQTYASSKMKMNFDDESNYLVSYDGISYQENAIYNNFPYLKITCVLDGSVNNDNNENKKEDNVDENASLNNPDVNQDNQKNDSSGNSDTSNTNKDNTFPSNDSTSKDDNDKPNDNHNEGNNSNNVEKEETNEDKSTNDNELKDDSHENNNSNINQGNGSNLGNNNSNNDLDKENSDVSTDDVYTNSEYEKNDEIYTDNEYDNEWTVEVENPKTYDGFGYKVFWLTFSLAGIIAFVFLMRYLNGKI